MFKFAIQQIPMEIIQTENINFRNKIIELYLETFSSGQSEQYIDSTEISRYIDGFFVDGKIIIAHSSNHLEGVLLYGQLNKDQLLPNKIKDNFQLEKCLYIAEIMVSEEFRGKGIGTQLIRSFFENADKEQYSDVFIRVWDENLAALSLYEKMGFQTVSSMNQKKIKADKSGTFDMKKIYLHKKLV